MFYTPIPVRVKQKCCELSESGQTSRQVYDGYFKKQFETPQTFKSFRASLSRWKQKIYADSTTLERGTYEGFVAHDATVQVNGEGEVVQAWVKQKAMDIDPEEFLSALKGNVAPYVYEAANKSTAPSDGMLEIPLFDMHWGVAFFDYYEPVLKEVIQVIKSRRWEKIAVIFGQDFFHNDSIEKGETTKGTAIEKVDMKRAVKDGIRFMFALVEAAIDHSESVRLLYSPGNHDRSTAWMCMQVFLERYGSEIVDDSLEFRKVISYGKNSVMITHGDSKRASPENLAHIFPIKFPEEFAKALIREVHAGHLHTESDKDVFGVMVRRLSSGNKLDHWSDKEDFVGSIKRFMLFDWSLDKLRSIYYV